MDRGIEEEERLLNEVRGQAGDYEPQTNRAGELLNKIRNRVWNFGQATGVGELSRRVFDFSLRNKSLLGLGAAATAATIGAGALLFKNRKKIARGAKKLFKKTVDAISLPFSNFFNSRKKRRKMSNDNKQQEIKPILPEQTVVTEQAVVASPILPQPVSGGLRELDEYGSPQSSQKIEDFDIVEEPEVNVETIPVVSPAANVQLIEPVEETSTLVPVKGNSKVYRCLKCKTFVSATKPHTAAECAARKCKEIKSTTSTRKRRRKVDKELLKSFRILERKKDAVTAKGAVISKKAQALMKKFNKNKKKSSPTIPKQIMNFLDSLSKKF